MAAFGDKIILLLNKSPGLTDREITDTLKGSSAHQQHVNLEARRLAAKGILKRTPRHDGKIGNYLSKDFSGEARSEDNQSVPKPLKRPQPKNTLMVSPSKKTRKIGDFTFMHICDIDPLRGNQGEVTEFSPQKLFKNENNLKLNKYGAGTFCKFKIPNKYNLSGVYALLVDDDVKYIGECVNLSQRYNMGYGNISPRNCFIGGQETNCRLNQLILKAFLAGSAVSLWFFETEEYKSVEAKLRAQNKYTWNRV